MSLDVGRNDLILNSAAAWAGISGVAELSDVALRRRVRGAGGWLGQIAGGAAGSEADRQRRPSGPPAAHHRRRCIGYAGADRTIWRLHAAYDPATASFTDLELTGAEAGEGFGRFTFSAGDLAVGDRGYAKPSGLQHVLAAGADFLAWVGWNSLRMTNPDAARLDPAALYATLSPGQIIGVPGVLTRPDKGSGRLPGRWFAARLVIMRQREAAVARAVREARRQHGEKAPNRALLPMALAAAGLLMVLTSLAPEGASPEKVMAIYRLRWQIELTFKRFRSGLGIHRLVAQNPVMAGNWLPSRLILALMTEDAAGEVLDSPPVRCANLSSPVSVWRLHGMMRFTPMGAVLRAFTIKNREVTASAVSRHVRDPSRRRWNQSATARIAGFDANQLSNCNRNHSCMNVMTKVSSLGSVSYLKRLV